MLNLPGSPRRPGQNLQIRDRSLRNMSGKLKPGWISRRLSKLYDLKVA